MGAMDYERPRDLPDFRALNVDLGGLIPAIGQVVSAGATATIDRYGYLYVTGFGGINPNVSIPVSVGEGYVAGDPGAILHHRLPQRDEVYNTITGPCGNVNLLLLTPQIVGTICKNASSAVVFGYSAGAALSLTLSWGIALPVGNPQSQWRIADLAWDYIDRIPGYTRADVEEMLANEVGQCDNCGQ
jgi:hypothetical protein